MEYGLCLKHGKELNGGGPKPISNKISNIHLTFSTIVCQVELKFE